MVVVMFGLGVVARGGLVLGLLDFAEAELVFGWGFVEQVCSSQVFGGEQSEDEVQDGSGVFDVGVLDGSGWVKACVDEFVDVFFQGDAVLEADGHGDGEAVEE